MDTLQATRLRKSKSPLLALASSAVGAPRQTTERRLTRANSVEPRNQQSPSIRSNRLNQEQETERLKATLKQARASEKSLKAEVDRLEQSLATEGSLKRDFKKRLARTEVVLLKEIETLQASLTRSKSKAISLKQEIQTQQTRLTEAASTESSLKREIKTQRSRLAEAASTELSLKREIKTQKSRLAEAASTELSLKRKIEELNESLVRNTSIVSKLRADNTVLKVNASKLKEDKNVLKTTFTHVLTSERDMRTSARETLEEWERVEKSLREEIGALKHVLEITSNDIEGGKAASRVQQTIQEKVRTHEDTIALRQPHKPLEGSSDIHILLDDLALQSLAIGGPNPTPHWTSDAFGSRLLPEFTALERATKGLQQAVNSELRTAYIGKCWSSRCVVPQRSANVARNLRLLVVLWEASGVEELLGSVTSILSDTAPTMGGEECAICTDPLLPEDRIMVEGCGHAMCKGCLREYIGARLGERVWPVRCPICMAESGPERRVQSNTVLTLALVIVGCG